MSFDNFKRRMSVKGNSQYERAMNRKQRSFEQWFNNTLTRHEISLNDTKYDAVIQDQNQANNKGLSDDKYLIVKNSTPTQVGSIVSWNEREWIIFSNEDKTIQTHKQHHIKPTNHVIKWMKEDGTVSGNGKGYHAYIQNNTLYTLGVAMSGSQAWVVNAKMLMYLPYSEEAKSIKIGQRIFIGENVYEVMMKDFVSRNGLIHFLLEENFYNPNTDDLENGIADRWKKEDEEGVSTGDKNNADNDVINSDNYTLSLQGSNTVKINKSILIKATMSNDTGNIIANPVKEWTVVDLNNVATVETQDQNNISIRIANNFSYVGKQITVVAKSDDGTTASKTVNIISPY